MATKKLNRPDFSHYVAHFTQGKKFHREDQLDVLKVFESMDAKSRLISILKSKTIYTSKMPWTDTQAVCFTECPWNSLLAHAENYSPYGIGFSKEYIFKKDGAPVFYVRSNLFEQLKKLDRNTSLTNKLWSFVTPFSPSYGTKHTKTCLRNGKKVCIVNYTHEREWRCPKDLSFEYCDIEFIIVKSLSDVKDILQIVPSDFENKIIVLDNYSQIEKLWPTHKV